MSKPNGYNSREKLKSRKALEILFAKGRSFSVFPIKVFYTATNIGAANETSSDVATITMVNATVDHNPMVQAGVGVSARNFKKAVERNRIKRLFREVYRTQKQALITTATNQQLHIDAFFLYIGKEMPDYALLKGSMEKLLQKFQEKINKDPINNTPTAGSVDNINNLAQ